MSKQLSKISLGIFSILTLSACSPFHNLTLPDGTSVNIHDLTEPASFKQDYKLAAMQSLAELNVARRNCKNMSNTVAAYVEDSQLDLQMQINAFSKTMSEVEVKNWNAKAKILEKYLEDYSDYERLCPAIDYAFQ